MTMTVEKIEQLREDAIRYGNAERIAEYSAAKLQYAEQLRNPAPAAAVEDTPEKITQEHIEAARAFARENPSVENIAGYSHITQMFWAQEHEWAAE